MAPGWPGCRIRGSWGLVACSPSPCLLVCVRCTVVCLVCCVYSCIFLGVDLHVVTAVVLYRSGVEPSRLQSSPARYDLSMQSLARAYLCRWKLLVYRVNIGSCIGSLLSSSCLRSVPGELRRLRRCSRLTGSSPSNCGRQDINLHVLSGRLRNVVIAWPHLVRGPCLSYLVFPGWALAAPRFVFNANGSPAPRPSSVRVDCE